MPDVSLGTKLDSVAQDASIGGASAAAAGDTGASTTNGFLRWLRDWFVARTGQKTAANSMSVVLSSDGPFSTNFGITTDSAASSDSATASFISLFKRLLGRTGVQVVIASDGVLLPASSLAQTLGYNASNQLTTVTVSYGGSSYVQTLTYTSGNLTGVSQWVKQ